MGIAPGGPRFVSGYELAADTIVAVIRARKTGIDMPLVDQFLEYNFLERESLAPAKMLLST
jgi:hypothetical protein